MEGPDQKDARLGVYNEFARYKGQHPPTDRDEARASRTDGEKASRDDETKKEENPDDRRLDDVVAKKPPEGVERTGCGDPDCEECLLCDDEVRRPCCSCAHVGKKLREENGGRRGEETQRPHTPKHTQCVGQRQIVRCENSGTERPQQRV